VLMRLKSAALSGGFGNPVVALIELGASLLTSLAAIVAPLLAVLLLLTLCVLAFRVAGRILFGRRRGVS